MNEQVVDDDQTRHGTLDRDKGKLDQHQTLGGRIGLGCGGGDHCRDLDV